MQVNNNQSLRAAAGPSCLRRASYLGAKLCRILEHGASLASATLYRIRAAFLDSGLEKMSINQGIASLRQNCKNLFFFLIVLFTVTSVTVAEDKEFSKGISKNVLIDGVQIRCQIADDPISRSRGLSGQEPLNAGEGMLFKFNQRARHRFWMKGMTFPIDIIWFDDGKIVHMVRGRLPKPGEALEVYSPDQPAQYVLEVAAGTASSHGWTLGSRVNILGEAQLHDDL